ncbi:hypothetical protein K438DRAFT_2021491 [Mycena galopus ATCC 62051]|nr:hypothetical protein K438DRAFT_2021491 [Mycena galopus ATCC 62051]
MSKWVSKLFTNLLVDPSSLRPTVEQHTPEPNDPSDNDDNDSSSDRSSAEPSSSRSEVANDAGTPEPAAGPATDADLIAILRNHTPSERILLELLQLITRRVHRHGNVANADFVSLWTDVLLHFPANGSYSTAAEISVARENILSALLTRRQQEHGSGGTPETAVYTTAAGVVMPCLDVCHPVRIKREESDPLPRHDTSVDFGADARLATEDNRANSVAPLPEPAPLPLQRHDAFVLGRPDSPPRRHSPSPSPTASPEPPPCPLQRHDAFVFGPPDSPPRRNSPSSSPTASPEPPQFTNDADDEEIKPSVKIEYNEESLSPQHQDATAGAAAFHAQLEPSAEYKPRSTAGAHDEDDVPSQPNPLNRQRVKHAVEEFSLQMLVPAAPHSMDESHSLPLAAAFVPADEDLTCAMVETPEPLNVVPLRISATRLVQEEISASLAVLGEGFDGRTSSPRDAPLAVEVRDEAALHSTERTPTHTDHGNGAAVVFVPADTSVPARGTDVAGLIRDATPTDPTTREYPHEVLGRHKRKRTAGEGAEDGESPIKRICGLEGRDTITRYTPLEMQVDATSVGSHRRLSED